MHLNVERGPMATGKTIRLHQKAKEAGLQEQHIIVGACHYGRAHLERLVLDRICRGDNVICLDECSPEQIKHLLQLKGDLPPDLIIHAVVAN